jgi:DNA-binding GntR family transcriptional regulator
VAVEQADEENAAKYMAIHLRKTREALLQWLGVEDPSASN